MHTRVLRVAELSYHQLGLPYGEGKGGWAASNLLIFCIWNTVIALYGN